MEGLMDEGWIVKKANGWMDGWMSEKMDIFQGRSEFHQLIWENLLVLKPMEKQNPFWVNIAFSCLSNSLT